MPEQNAENDAGRTRTGRTLRELVAQAIHDDIPPGFRAKKEAPMPENEMTYCEYGDCGALAFRILTWGPRADGQRRAACWKHEGEADISRFRTSVTSPGMTHPETKEANDE